MHLIKKFLVLKFLLSSQHYKFCMEKPHITQPDMHNLYQKNIKSGKVVGFVGYTYMNYQRHLFIKFIFNLCKMFVPLKYIL